NHEIRSDPVRAKVGRLHGHSVWRLAGRLGENLAAQSPRAEAIEQEGGGSQQGVIILGEPVIQVLKIHHLPGATAPELLKAHLLQGTAQAAWSKRMEFCTHSRWPWPLVHPPVSGDGWIVSRGRSALRCSGMTRCSDKLLVQGWRRVIVRVSNRHDYRVDERAAKLRLGTCRRK